MNYPNRNTQDRFEQDFDKAFNRIARVMGVWWVICAVLGIALTVTIIWAIVQVVQATT